MWADMQKSIELLKNMGRMPDESTDDLSSERIDQYAALLKQIEPPITLEEAEILVQLFPEYALFGVEWTLLHILEKAQISFPEKYEQLIEKCPSIEWRNTLKARLKNNKENKE